MDKDIITKRFTDAGLELEFISRPIDPNNPAIFQMDIKRRVKGNMRTEYFRIWPGQGAVRAEVICIDKKIKQLVLLVQEPERYFEVIHHILRSDEIPKIRAMGTVVRETPTSIVIRQKTDPRKRRFLMGVDERQLFVAQIQKGNTVKEAHANLKAPTLLLAEGQVPGRAKRQGEWFFINLTVAEERELADYLKRYPYALHKKMPITSEPNMVGTGRRVGNPHTAEEIVHIPRWEAGDVTRVERTEDNLGRKRVVARPRPYDVYVRGNVTHKEHKRMKFASWKRVIRNAEVAPKSGIMWID